MTSVGQVKVTAMVPATAPKERLIISKRGCFLSGRYLCLRRSKEAILMPMNGMMPTTEAKSPLKRPRVPSLTKMFFPQSQMPSFQTPGVLTWIVSIVLIKSSGQVYRLRLADIIEEIKCLLNKLTKVYATMPVRLPQSSLDIMSPPFMLGKRVCLKSSQKQNSKAENGAILTMLTPLPLKKPLHPSTFHMYLKAYDMFSPWYSAVVTCLNIFSLSRGLVAVRDTDPAIAPVRKCKQLMLSLFGC